jgi:hypothetical protein
MSASATITPAPATQLMRLLPVLATPVGIEAAASEAFDAAWTTFGRWSVSAEGSVFFGATSGAGVVHGMLGFTTLPPQVSSFSGARRGSLVTTAITNWPRSLCFHLIS